MCPGEGKEEQTVDHLVFQCTKLSNQRTEMVKQINNTGGNWPTMNETLNNYLPIFVKFVKSINFTDLQ